MDNTYPPYPTDLDAEGLVLQPWQLRDATAIVEAVRESSTSLAPWLPWCHADYALADAQAYIADCRDGWDTGSLYAFAIRERAGGKLLGSVGLSQLDHANRSANLGYWVRQTQLGQGMAARAARLAAQFGFGPLKLIRIEIVIEPGNHASRRTAERCGARFEAIARHRLWLHERATDGAVYALVPSDLEQNDRSGRKA